MTSSTPSTKRELLQMLQLIRKCPCERCPDGHSQKATGCPLCDMYHGDYRLFTNQEVSQLLDQYARAICEEVIGADIVGDAAKWGDNWSERQKLRAEQRSRLDTLIPKPKEER